MSQKTGSYLCYTSSKLLHHTVREPKKWFLYPVSLGMICHAATVTGRDFWYMEVPQGLSLQNL